MAFLEKAGSTVWSETAPCDSAVLLLQVDINIDGVTVVTLASLPKKLSTKQSLSPYHLLWWEVRGDTGDH